MINICRGIGSKGAKENYRQKSLITILSVGVISSQSCNERGDERKLYL